MTSFYSSSEGDLALSRSLAMLLKSTTLPLCDNSTDPQTPFRMPDHPYSLFEGLAGSVCAWLDACVVIRERLEGGTPSEALQRPGVLGIPGLGGAGAQGLL